MLLPCGLIFLFQVSKKVSEETKKTHPCVQVYVFKVDLTLRKRYERVPTFTVNLGIMEREVFVSRYSVCIRVCLSTTFQNRSTCFLFSVDDFV